MNSLRHLAHLTAPILALLLGACGGSGGGGVGGGGGDDPLPDYTTFYGEYRLISFSGTVGSGGGAGSRSSVGYGIGTADGEGVLVTVSQTIATSDGPPMLPGPMESTIQYTESDDGSLRLSAEIGGGMVEMARGYVSPDGAHAVIAVTEPFPPGCMFLSRAERDCVAGQFLGDYHTALWAVGLDHTGWVTAVGDAVVDPDGTVMHIIRMMSGEGAVLFGAWPQASDWLSAADGDFDLSIRSGGFAYTGGLACGGDALLTAGSLHADQGPTVKVLVRESAGRTNADFAGNYYAVGLTYDADDAHYKSYFGAVRPDGAGLYQRAFTVNDEGTHGMLMPITTSYTVEDDGRLDINLATTIGTYRGGLSPDGSLAVVAGGTTAGDPTGLFILMRR